MVVGKKCSVLTGPAFYLCKFCGGSTVLREDSGNINNVCQKRYTTMVRWKITGSPGSWSSLGIRMNPSWIKDKLG